MPTQRKNRFFKTTDSNVQNTYLNYRNGYVQRRDITVSQELSLPYDVVPEHYLHSGHRAVDFGPAGTSEETVGIVDESESPESVSGGIKVEGKKPRNLNSVSVGYDTRHNFIT